MTTDEKQKELDLVKWNKSQSLRLDACGTFNYCANCNISLKNPCAHAYSKFYNEELEGEEELLQPVVEEKEPVVEVKEEKKTKSTCAKKTTAKTETKKTTTKKTSTTKKTTKSTK